MESLPQWGNTILIIALIIIYWYNSKVQQEDNKRLHSQINTLETSNKVIMSLFESQASHLDTYKKMVDIDELEKYIRIKAANLFAELVVDSPDLKEEIANEMIEKFLSSAVNNLTMETLAFTKFILVDVFKLGKDQQRAFIEAKFTKSKDLVLLFFDLSEHKLDIQNTPNQ